MPVPFGFSVGDFLACANTLKDIGLALRDHGGASSKYQQTLRELESIQAVLEELQSTKNIGDNPVLLNAIRGQAQAVQYAVSHFLGKISTLDPALGSSAPKGFYRGTLSKAKWVTTVGKEVTHLWQALQSQSISLKILLSMHGTREITRLAETEREIKDLISSTSARSIRLLEKANSSISVLAASVKRNADSSRDEPLLHIGSIGMQVAAVEHAMGNHNKLEQQTMVSKITSRLEDLHKSIRDAFSTGLAQNSDLVSSLHQRLATSAQVDELSQQVHNFILQAKAEASCKQTHASAEQVDRRRQMFETSPFFNPDQRQTSWWRRCDSVPSSNTNVPALKCDRPLLGDVLRDLFIVLSSDLAEVFTRALVMLIRHLHNLLHVWPQLLLAWQVLRRLPPTISLVLHDNITFEDVLGRIHSLQYQQFKHWRVFKRSLEESFKGLPGSKRVRTGQFLLTGATAPDTLYDKFNWSQKIRPGSSLVMSVVIDAASRPVQNCPRCEQGVAKTEGRSRFCAGCGLRWEVLKPAPKAVYESLDKLVAKARRKRERLGKRDLAEIIREMRQRFLADPEARSGRANGRQSADLKNVQHSLARGKRPAHNCSELKFFKRVHLHWHKQPLEDSIVGNWDLYASPTSLLPGYGLLDRQIEDDRVHELGPENCGAYKSTTNEAAAATSSFHDVIMLENPRKSSSILSTRSFSDASPDECRITMPLCPCHGLPMRPDMDVSDLVAGAQSCGVSSLTLARDNQDILCDRIQSMFSLLLELALTKLNAFNREIRTVLDPAFEAVPTFQASLKALYDLHAGRPLLSIHELVSLVFMAFSIAILTIDESDLSQYAGVMCIEIASWTEDLPSQTDKQAFFRFLEIMWLPQVRYSTPLFREREFCPFTNTKGLSTPDWRSSPLLNPIGLRTGMTVRLLSALR